jgi:hypothetical protein
MDNYKDLVLNLFVLAVIPALGEELLFRGLLQKMFNELFKNKHIAILVTAAIFSAIHMQFYGFIPRMLLGALFGYLLVWSGSIWVPVLAHFFNNAMVVIFSYLSSKSLLPFDENTIGTENNHMILLIVSSAIVGGLLFLLSKSTVPIQEKTEH